MGMFVYLLVWITLKKNVYPNYANNKWVHNLHIPKNLNGIKEIILN